MKETIRDSITGELTLDYFVKRAAQGWKVASIDWVREAEEEVARVEPPPILGDKRPAALPYGLQVSPASAGVEENTLEAAVLVSILEQIIQEKRVTEIAAILNAQGHRTREGWPWSASAVFELLPRLVEVGPGLLKNPAWQQRRARPASMAN